MSNLIAKFNDEDSELRVISFYGGEQRGPCIQLSTIGPTEDRWGEAIELEAFQVELLAKSLTRWLTERAEARSRKSVNEKLDALARRYDTGEFTNAQYLAEITKVVSQ